MRDAFAAARRATKEREALGVPISPADVQQLSTARDPLAVMRLGAMPERPVRVVHQIEEPPKKRAPEPMPSPTRPGRCAVCADHGVTMHHLVPVAARWRLAALPGEPNTVPLCPSCHSLAHERFGEGHVWDGPVSLCGLVNDLRSLLRFRAP